MDVHHAQPDAQGPEGAEAERPSAPQPMRRSAPVSVIPLLTSEQTHRWGT